MKNLKMLLPGVVLALASIAHATDDTPDARAIVEAVKPSMVLVEYEFQYDKGDPPQGTGWGMYWSPTSTRYHENLLDFIQQERPAERPGFLLDDSTVITSDPVVNQRFIKSIRVRQGDQVVAAQMSAIARDEAAILLTLDQPLSSGAGLAFGSSAGDAKKYLVTHDQHNAEWMTTVRPLPEAMTLDASGDLVRGVPREALIVTGDGTPLGMTYNGRIAGDDGWMGSPKQWAMMDMSSYASAMGDLADAAGASVLRVKLSFRSPKKSDEAAGSRGYYMDPSDAETERNEMGVMIDNQRMLVLTMLKPNVTARLERIRVFGPGSEEIAATFVGSLQDYGGFVVDLEQPISGVRGLNTQDITQYQHVLLPEAKVLVQGESRVPYYQHERLAVMSRGWNNHIYPEDSPSVDEFVFDSEGRLLAIPIARRLKPSLEETWGSSEPVLTASMYLARVMDNLSAHLDETNIPLSEDEENRIAWLGVELQPMDRELARASDVADLTNDGQTGAIVTHTYPGSPAASVGLDMGDILLRVHVPEHPKPIDISADQDMFGGAFPWERLDDLPEEYYDQIPSPWPSAQSSLNTTLTELGFGTDFELEFVRDGEVQRAQLTVTESPPHFVAAKKFEYEPLGVTVKDLTYEVQRYLQRMPDEPGVIVSKIEPGSKVSTAGLKPYEMITHVNDEPVMSADQFSELIAGITDIKLSVKRMARGRIVKVELDESDIVDE